MPAYANQLVLGLDDPTVWAERFSTALRAQRSVILVGPKSHAEWWIPAQKSVQTHSHTTILIPQLDRLPIWPELSMSLVIAPATDMVWVLGVESLDTLRQAYPADWQALVGYCALDGWASISRALATGDLAQAADRAYALAQFLLAQFLLPPRREPFWDHAAQALIVAAILWVASPTRDGEAAWTSVIALVTTWSRADWQVLADRAPVEHPLGLALRAVLCAPNPTFVAIQAIAQQALEPMAVVA